MDKSTNQNSDDNPAPNNTLGEVAKALNEQQLAIWTNHIVQEKIIQNQTQSIFQNVEIMSGLTSHIFPLDKNFFTEAQYVQHMKNNREILNMVLKIRANVEELMKVAVMKVALREAFLKEMRDLVPKRKGEDDCVSKLALVAVEIEKIMAALEKVINKDNAE